MPRLLLLLAAPTAVAGAQARPFYPTRPLGSRPGARPRNPRRILEPRSGVGPERKTRSRSWNRPSASPPMSRPRIVSGSPGTSRMGPFSTRRRFGSPWRIPRTSPSALGELPSRDQARHGASGRHYTGDVAVYHHRIDPSLPLVRGSPQTDPPESGGEVSGLAPSAGFVIPRLLSGIGSGSACRDRAHQRCYIPGPRGRRCTPPQGREGEVGLRVGRSRQAGR